MMNRLALLGLSFVLTLFACSSSQKSHDGALSGGGGESPDWIRQPTRTVDGGYIVYVGSADDTSEDRAKMKAESAAIQDLANECSFPPKGTRIEDHYQDTQSRRTVAFAKVAVSIIDCDQAKSANTPEAIQKVANVSMTDQLKKYQEQVYGPSEVQGEKSEMNPMALSTVAPPPIENNDQYFIMRQRVAYVKEMIILQSVPTVAVATPPPGVTAPVTVAPSQTKTHPVSQTETLAHELTHQNDRLRDYEAKNPDTQKWAHSWSEFERTTTAQIPDSVPHRKNVASTSPHKEHQARHEPSNVSNGSHRGRGKKKRYNPVQVPF